MRYSILDPTGNITALVESPVDPAAQPEAAREIMRLHPDVEQVGFLRIPEQGDVQGELRMAGGEFCGNASMCAAALLHRQGRAAETVRLRISGAALPVEVRLRKTAEGYAAGVRMPRARATSKLSRMAKATPSSTAWTKSARVVSMLMPVKVPRASLSLMGLRSPIR